MTISKTCSVLAPVALSLTAVCAQSIPTTPVDNFAREGIASSLAVANNTHQLAQCIYESGQVYRPLQQWSTLHLRPDAGAFQRDFPAMTRHLTIRMSGRGVPSPELASKTSFLQNRGSDFATVLNDRAIAFPARTQDGAQPAPFTVPIPLDQPFPMSHQVLHLLVEIETRPEASGSTQFPWFPDAAWWDARPWTVATSTFGTSCGGSYGVMFSGQTSTLSMSFGFARAPGSNGRLPALAWLGGSDASWGPLPLPFPLDLIGAPGCAIHTEPLVSFAGVTGGGSSERFTLNVAVPRDYRLLGTTLFSQTMVADPLAGNAAGLRASGGGRIFFSSPPDPYRALTLVRRGSSGDVPDEVTPNQAIVLGVQ